MRRALIALALCAALSVRLAAQISVHDPAVTARNTVTAAVKELLLDTERLQHSQLRRMAQRFSLFTTLAKYAIEDPPRWRTHGGDFLFTQAYNDALDLWRPWRGRLSRCESSLRGCQGSAGEAYAGALAAR